VRMPLRPPRCKQAVAPPTSQRFGSARNRSFRQKASSSSVKGHVMALRKNFELYRVSVQHFEILSSPCLTRSEAPGTQCLRKVMPVFEQPNVEHGEDAAEYSVGFFHRETWPLRGVEVERCRAGAFPIENFIATRASKKSLMPRGAAQVRLRVARPRAGGCRVSKTDHFHRGEKHLGVPETKGSLQNGRWIKSIHKIRAAPLRLWVPKAMFCADAGRPRLSQSCSTDTAR